MPSIAFGTWMLGNGQGPIDHVEQAISVGFGHIGTIDIASLLRDAWHN
jgi:diketogulonate reductase-like aldo/keto reductase